MIFGASTLNFLCTKARRMELSLGTLRKVSHLSKPLVIVITLVFLTSVDIMGLSMGSENCDISAITEPHPLHSLPLSILEVHTLF